MRRGQANRAIMCMLDAVAIAIVGYKVLNVYAGDGVETCVPP
jgi:hypothetical protein